MPDLTLDITLPPLPALTLDITGPRGDRGPKGDPADPAGVFPPVVYPDGPPGSIEVSNQARSSWSNLAVPELAGDGRRVWVPMVVPVAPRTAGWTRLCVYVITGAAAVWRLMLYEVRPDGFPGDVLVDAGQVNMSGTGRAESTISFAPAAAVPVWACAQVDTYTANPTVVAAGLGTGDPFMPAGFSTQSGNPTRGWSGLYDAQGTGGAASVAGAQYTNNAGNGFVHTENAPRIWLRSI